MGRLKPFSWGNTLINGSNGIKATSKTCSVYSVQGKALPAVLLQELQQIPTAEFSDLTEHITSRAHSAGHSGRIQGKADNGTNVQQYRGTGGNNQKFKLVSDGTANYTIYTGASNYKSCLDVYNWSRDNGANINQWQYHGGDCQKFQRKRSATLMLSRQRSQTATHALTFTNRTQLTERNINQAYQVKSSVFGILNNIRFFLIFIFFKQFRQHKYKIDL